MNETTGNPFQSPPTANPTPETLTFAQLLKMYRIPKIGMRIMFASILTFFVGSIISVLLEQFLPAQFAQIEELVTALAIGLMVLIYVIVLGAVCFLFASPYGGEKVLAVSVILLSGVQFAACFFAGLIFAESFAVSFVMHTFNIIIGTVFLCYFKVVAKNVKSKRLNHSVNVTLFCFYGGYVVFTCFSIFLIVVQIADKQDMDALLTTFLLTICIVSAICITSLLWMLRTATLELTLAHRARTANH